MFPRLSCFRFLVICRYPYLNKFVENSVKNQQFFRLSNFMYFGLRLKATSYLSVLILQLFCLVFMVSFFSFNYMTQSVYFKYGEILRFCFFLFILAVSIISMDSLVLNVSRVSQLMRSTASPLCSFLFLIP